MTMLDLLKEIALGRIEASAGQIRAAIAAAQYEHAKKGEGGKKEEASKKAQEAGKKFGSRPAPRLVHSK